MGERGSKGNKKETIWRYAIILFASAFIVLLLTAYSQIKFNKNISEYRSQISNEEKAKVGVQTNLNTAIEDNKKMAGELKLLRDELAKVNVKQKESDKQALDSKSKYNAAISSYEALIAAEKKYNAGDIINCAILLHTQCNASLLGSEALDRYKFLEDAAFVNAARKLFIDGCTDYKNKKYENAIKKLKDSNSLAENQYFSDDCFYFIAYSQFMLGDKSSAKESIQVLFQKYDDSNYKEDAETLLESLGT